VVITIVIILISLSMDLSSHGSSADRHPVAAGRFYSENKETLAKDISELFYTCRKANTEAVVRALISPHAGYVFSGKIAASAFSAIQNKECYKNIFIIGSSHVMAFEGASVYNSGDFITPLGKKKVNLDLANKLRTGNKYFNFPLTAHLQEHSIEVQIPFIQYYFDDSIRIIPIIIGTENKNTIMEIANTLKPYFIPENLFLISSDFSHYPSYQDAYNIDELTASAIISKNSDTFLKTLKMNASKGITGLSTSMCGWTSGLVLLYLAEEDPSLIFKHISYCNSGDSNYGNKNEVVGYHAIELIVENKETGELSNKDEVKFTREEASALIAISRNSIKAKLSENPGPVSSYENLPEIFKRNMGAFVTLKSGGKLRGCIGRFTSHDPLYKVVSQMAVSSAFDDARFLPLTYSEFEDIEIEISVLGPLKKISNIKEIVLGKHGIYIKKDLRTGTMLPQVAIENNWTVEEFLGYTSREKAGLGWTGWKEAEIYIYEAAILKEN
jgi:AmmeMemoRadiSam system protein B/AmmeMemoRadiSam system protein A